MTNQAMFTDQNILCISNPQWDGDYAKAIVELMSVMARGNRVLYADSAYTVTDVLRAIAGKGTAPVKRIFGISKRIRQMPVQNGAFVNVLTLPVLLPINFMKPGPMYDRLLRLNGRRVTRCIRKALRTLDMEKDLLNMVAFNPALGLVCGRKFNERWLIYHCYDEINAAKWLSRHGGEQERQFMQMADAVIVTSQGLYERKKDLARRCYLVRNGVNYQLFRKGFKHHEERRNLRVGFTGSLDERVDYALLDELIGSMPGARFIFVGRIVSTAAVNALRRHANAEFTGSKNVREIPAFLSTFSASIIPFLKNDFNKGIYPLKINEYLAAGLPVVATDFSYLDEFRELIGVAHDAAGFSSLIMEMTASDNDQQREKRSAFASLNSWDARAEEISQLIFNNLA